MMTSGLVRGGPFAARGCSWSLALAMALAACGGKVRGGEGESCLRRADCAEGLGCFERVCRREPPASCDGAGERRAAAEAAPAVATPAERERGGEPAADERPPAGPAPGAPVLHGDAVEVLGPYPDLGAFCRKEYPGMACGPRTTEGARDEGVEGVGEVEIIDVGDAEVAVGVAVETPRGVFVVSELVIEGGGAGQHDFVKRSWISSAAVRGTFRVGLMIQRFETVWTKTDRPRSEQPTREVQVAVVLTCALDGAGSMSCVKKEETARPKLVPRAKTPAAAGARGGVPRSE